MWGSESIKKQTYDLQFLRFIFLERSLYNSKMNITIGLNIMADKKYISEIKEFMQEWDYEANKDLDPTKLTIGSNKKAWWKCPKCGGKWWKAGITGGLIGLTSQLLEYYKVANKADVLSFDFLGDMGSFTSKELNSINAITNTFNTDIIATSYLGLAIETSAPNIIESTIISPTLGVYNE